MFGAVILNVGPTSHLPEIQGEGTGMSVYTKSSAEFTEKSRRYIYCEEMINGE